MIADLAPLLPISAAAFWTGFAVFVRVSALMATMPAFGDQAVPMRVRLVIALMFSLIVGPAVSPQIGAVPASALAAATLLGPEVIAGLFFGLFLRFFIIALQVAGSIAAQSTSLSQIFGGTTGVDPQPAIGHVLVVGGTALAALLGLHVQVAAYMIQGYQMVPFGVAIRPDVVISVGLAEVSRAFSLGFMLAAPFVIASLIYNVVLGVINKAMPQLMVSFVGAPAITAGGLLLFLITAPIMLSIWAEALGEFMFNPFGSPR